MVVTDDQVGPLYLEGLVAQLGMLGSDAHDSGGRGVQKAGQRRGNLERVNAGSVQSQMLFDRRAR